MSHTVEKKDLYLPPLQEVCAVLQKGLALNFKDVRVEVTECPDLTEPAWGLAAPGLSGSPKIGEAGGVPYLVPLHNKDKIYNMQDVSKAAGFTDSLFIGAGAGPFNYVGVNSELIANAKMGSAAINKSRIAKVVRGNCVLEQLPQDQTGFAILMNFFACEGKRGPVIKVSAKQRLGRKDFIGCMRQALEAEYGDKSVGFGGVFRLNKGRVKIHVMPSFSETPLKTDEDLNKWLNFFTMSAPMVFMSVAVSRDPGMDFRLEHTHGYGAVIGGHYHYDVTPDEVEYEGFFNLAEQIVRIDRPPKQ